MWKPATLLGTLRGVATDGVAVRVGSGCDAAYAGRGCGAPSLAGDASVGISGAGLVAATIVGMGREAVAGTTGFAIGLAAAISTDGVGSVSLVGAATGFCVAATAGAGFFAIVLVGVDFVTRRLEPFVLAVLVAALLVAALLAAAALGDAVFGVVVAMLRRDTRGTRSSIELSDRMAARFFAMDFTVEVIFDVVEVRLRRLLLSLERFDLAIRETCGSADAGVGTFSVRLLLERNTRGLSAGRGKLGAAVDRVGRLERATVGVDPDRAAPVRPADGSRIGAGADPPLRDD